MAEAAAVVVERKRGSEDTAEEGLIQKYSGQRQPEAPDCQRQQNTSHSVEVKNSLFLRRHISFWTDWASYS